MYSCVAVFESSPYPNTNLNSVKTSVALQFVIILQNIMKANHRKSVKSEYDRKLTKLDVETTRIRCRVNGVLSLKTNAKHLDSIMYV